jgi:hypothetical protein
MMSGQARSPVLIIGFDNYMIAGNRACSTSTPTRRNRTMPRPWAPRPAASAPARPAAGRQPVVASDPSQRRGDVAHRGSFAEPGGGHNAAIRRAGVEVVGRAVGLAHQRPARAHLVGTAPGAADLDRPRAPRAAASTLHPAADRPIPLVGCGSHTARPASRVRKTFAQLHLKPSLIR